MLTVRQAQMEAFQRSNDMRFAFWICDFLRRHESELVAGFSDLDLRRQAMISIDRARYYGISEALSVAEFSVAMVRLGSTFDSDPNVRAVLTDPSLPPDARIHRIWSQVQS
jgi:hypothetical protein